jgi:hypothetical protein
MTSTRIPTLAALATGLTLLISGCATGPAAPVAQHLNTPSGATMTFTRQSSGSFGSGTGQVQWTYGETTWQGARVITAESPQAGTVYHQPGTYGIVANLNPAGQVLYAFDPPLSYEWPLWVGKTWTSSHTMTVPATQQKIPLELVWEVEAYEYLQVKAGRFPSYRIVVRNDKMGEIETRWTSPSAGLPLVKRVQERTASHPQGAGRLEGELTAYRMPGR